MSAPRALIEKLLVKDGTSAVPIETLPHWLQVVAHGLPSFWFSRLALRTLGYSNSSPLLGWALLGAYTVVFLLAAAFIFRRQEAQA